MIKKVAALLIAIIAIVLGYATTRPDSFTVQRNASIKAPPEKIYAVLSDFHKWGAWSPWENTEPNMQRTHSGAESGSGAAYEWSGDKKVGHGKMEIIEA